MLVMFEGTNTATRSLPMIAKVNDVFAVVAYRIGRSEEGNWEYPDGFNVIVKSNEGERFIYTGHIGHEYCCSPKAFADEAAAMRFAERIDLNGSIETHNGWFQF
jgi:hypothetical protein